MVCNSTSTYSTIYKDYQVIPLLLFLAFIYNYSESWILQTLTIHTKQSIHKKQLSLKKNGRASRTSLEKSRSPTLRNFKKAASPYEIVLSSNELDNEEHNVVPKAIQVLG